MIRIDHKKAQAFAGNAAGQAATELAVFGAILIFILGTIIRSAVSNSYMQNQDFKAMRMAMLASWEESKSNPGLGAPQVTAHNSAQVIFLEDRLSPDYNKYGDMDRTPFIASGSGTFSYNLLYPLSDSTDVINSLPVQDVWINGQHFPFTLASYNPDYELVKPSSAGSCQLLETAGNTCQANQCYRNYREWSGGLIHESSFISSTVAPYTPITGQTCLAMVPGDTQRTCQENSNACNIFALLSQGNPSVIDFKGTLPQGDQCSLAMAPFDSSVVTTSVQTIASSPPWPAFVSAYESEFPGLTATQYKKYLNAILSILQPVYAYKLFYTIVPNPGGNAPTSSSGVAQAQFSTTALPCPSHPCQYNELSQDVPLLDYYGNLTTDGSGNTTNVNGVMQYDLLRMGYYSTSDATPPPCATAAILPCQPVTETSPIMQFPPGGALRNYIAWQWSATAGTTAAMIGLNTSNDQFPTYDVDGRLKQVVIYKIRQDSGHITHVAFEDPEGGDIDQTWDTNSCGPKPGLQQTQMQIFTFTQNGTYLLIKEGQLFNPETGQVVRSANKRDNIDLIQRSIQLSNNTGRFCTPNSNGTYGGAVTDGTVITYPCTGGGDCANPNPVEACINEKPCNCFMGGSASSPVNQQCGMTLAETCYDTLQNVIYVRSRLQDLRGRFWMTNASGQLKVQ